MEYLKLGIFTAVPTDKDGGYAVVHKELLNREFMAVLSGSLYKLEPRSCLHADDLLHDYMLAAETTGHMGDDKDLLKALYSQMSSPANHAYFGLGATVKTHNDPGAVVLTVALDVTVFANSTSDEVLCQSSQAALGLTSSSSD